MTDILGEITKIKVVRGKIYLYFFSYKKIKSFHF